MAIISSSPPLPWMEAQPGPSPENGRRRTRAAVFVYPAALAGKPGSGGNGAAAGEASAAAALAAGESPEELEAAAFERGRAAGRAEAEARIRRQAAADLSAERAAIGMVVGAFARARAGYFVQVEGEVVRLALSIARRILHREAQIDPLLLRGAVRLALERLDQTTRVTLRVPAGRAGEWQRAFATPQGLPAGAQLPAVVEDTALGGDECALETELGETRCSTAEQLAEIEQGFFDLIAERSELAGATAAPAVRAAAAAGTESAAS